MTPSWRFSSSLFENASEAASNDAIFDAYWRFQSMRTTVTLDDELLRDAEKFTGIKERSALLREALRALVQREATHRLILLGGSEPDLELPRRRRPWNE